MSKYNKFDMLDVRVSCSNRTSFDNISLHDFTRKNNGPHLVIAPNSTLKNWSNEIKRFCPSLKSVVLIGDKTARSETLEYMKVRKNWDVCVTSYEMVVREKGPLKRYSWKYVVVDEAHRIKNENTILSKELRKFSSENRLLLTGTPLQVS